MPYNFVGEGFHTKKLCRRLSSSEVQFYTENGRFAKIGVSLQQGLIQSFREKPTIILVTKLG